MNIRFHQKLRDRVVQEYRHLEDRFLELTEYIPLEPDLRFSNYKISSPRAASFGLDCCTWLDTLFEELLMDRNVDKYSGIERIRKDKKNRNINHYRRVFEKELNFSDRYGSLKYFPGSKIRPYKSWKKGENPEWWKLYSEYKHERLELAEKFTMGHALESFTALSLVVTIWTPLDGTFASEHKSRVFSYLR